jgi:hypothetical protein
MMRQRCYTCKYITTTAAALLVLKRVNKPLAPKPHQQKISSLLPGAYVEVEAI